MSDIQEKQAPATQGIPAQDRGRDGSGLAQRQQQDTSWRGWIVFASLMMILVGAFQAILGVVAVLYRGFYVVSSSGLAVQVSYTAWGAVHLALGLVALAAGFALLQGQLWARVVGITMAVLSAIVNLAFIPAYPAWSIIVIALDVIVIYAIAAHGRSAAARS